MLEIAAFSKTSRSTYAITFKNGVQVSLINPYKKEPVSLIEQIESLFHSAAAYLEIHATYSHGNQIEDITEALTGMKGDYAVGSAEELADVLYKAKNYTSKNFKTT